MKQPPSVSRLLIKINEVFEDIRNISKYIQRNGNSNLRVTFHHDENRVLIFSKWSDQYYGAIDSVSKNTKYEYTYEVTSNGIHFLSFSERDLTQPWWHSSRSWYSSGDESKMRLVEVPNQAPAGYKGTMYMMHQEKIKETLSSLPAWAIAVMDY